ncbi:MAG TPA: hypothetical protein DDW94_05145 [Deltaproteobacteria bacterium]|nr:hypothetical protein [Deltaproteobacteria bacterium]HCY11566.1 hypothetical protein [Deltaproteobacteria bacterium]
MHTAMTINDALKKHGKKLMSVEGVVGVAEGICGKRPCIKVYVAKKAPEQEKIPRELDGYPVEVELTGEFRGLK